MQPGATDVRQAVRLARGDRVRLTIPVPIFGDNENIRFEIREDGRTLERFNYTGFQSGSLPSDASALIVADRCERVWKDGGSVAENDESGDGFGYVASGTVTAVHTDGPALSTSGQARQLAPAGFPARTRRVCRPTGSGTRRCARSSSDRTSGSN